MENQDDVVYCKLLAEVLKNCEKELEKETQEFNGYKKEREEQEIYIREAIAEEYNKVLNKIQESYDALVQYAENELERSLLEYHTKTKLMFDEKVNESLRDSELQLQSVYNKLVQQNESLDRQFDNEWYEVDKLRMDLLKINTEIEKFVKLHQVPNEKIVFVQFHVDQIKNKNLEIVQLYDRLSQNLQNKITQIEDDIERMEHLCNYLQNDDSVRVGGVNNMSNTTSDVNRCCRSNIQHQNQNQDAAIDCEAID